MVSPATCSSTVLGKRFSVLGLLEIQILSQQSSKNRQGIGEIDQDHQVDDPSVSGHGGSGHGRAAEQLESSVAIQRVDQRSQMSALSACENRR